MGIFCGIDKDGDADQMEKPANDSPRRLSVSYQLRQIFDRMTDKLLNLVSEPTQQQSSRGTRAQLRLDFQNEMMEIASLEEKAANERLLEDVRADDKLYRTSPPLNEFDGRHFAEDHFSRNVDIIEKTRLLDAARRMPKGAHLHIHFNSTLLPGFLLDIAKEMPNMYISSPTHKLRSKYDFDNCEIVFNLRNLNTMMDDLNAGPALQDQDLLSGDLRGPNLFRDDYEPRQQMRYQYFRTMWDKERNLRQSLISQGGDETGSAESEVWDMNMECDNWLIRKLIFSKEEVDLIFHTSDKSSGETRKPETKEEKEARQKKAEDSGWPKDIELEFQDSPHRNVRERATRAWEKFNGRTRMMKGLFNYEKAFRAYTRKCLEEFVMENVQYAEIRPNFMKSNQVLRDDGIDGFDNFGLMRIIIEEYEHFMKDIGDMDADGQIKENRKLDSQGKPIYSEITGLPLANGHIPSLGGMKVIYCTPRSFQKPMVKEALKECIQMKKKWPQYIAGFDLVGEEAYNKPFGLRYFEEEFNEFQDDCRKENVEIPFLFHCGETPDDLEGNLQCALDLDAKRVGHGYALPEKPEIMKQMKAKNVCVEACPISNMVLGLVERMDEHRIYDLLAHEVHCTLNSDNGTLFRSTLSHDFYEVMVGNRNMNLYGWRQLAQWSIDHSCLNQDERERILVEWERRWKEEFIPEVLGKPPTNRPARLNRLDKIEETRQKRMAEPRL
ncbi:Metallo-dependent hydrolase [Hypoxylon crocopeplum]|nr:Metallo-dependent hydrolase [Hypoxylon crocopeplum]